MRNFIVSTFPSILYLVTSRRTKRRHVARTWRVLTWTLKGAMRNNEEGFAPYVAKGKVEPYAKV
jgi:hypothetical protein